MCALGYVHGGYALGVCALESVNWGCAHWVGVYALGMCNGVVDWGVYRYGSLGYVTSVERGGGCEIGL